MTIRDVVVDGTFPADGYAERVHAWAEATLAAWGATGNWGAFAAPVCRPAFARPYYARGPMSPFHGTDIMTR